MKTAGIIAEYNPFHKGHAYQIQTLRAQTGADFVIAAMSGDFVQRGEPALYDKYTRTRMALNMGVDLVVELPVPFAVSSAEDFAACGVALLTGLGVTDVLCFGSECGELSWLQTAARLLLDEPEPYRDLLKAAIRQGEPYPRARQLALTGYLEKSGKAGSTLSAPAKHSPDSQLSLNQVPWESLLSAPNNILGIEYLKALARQNSPMTPVTIRREGQGYHIQARPAPGEIASASAIRQALRTGDAHTAAAQMPVLPPAGSPFLPDSKTVGPDSPNSGDNSRPGAIRSLCAAAIFPDDLSALINYRLLELSQENREFSDFSDVSPDLAQRIRRQLLDFDTFSARVEALKSRQYTYTRISRALLHILLSITDEEIRVRRQKGYVSWTRILGFRRDAAPLLSELKKRSSLPVITKTADAAAILCPEDFRYFSQDLHRSHIYQSLVQEKTGQRPKNEFTHSVVVV